jgi:hypothetical protein
LHKKHVADNPPTDADDHRQRLLVGSVRPKKIDGNMTDNVGQVALKFYERSGIKRAAGRLSSIKFAARCGRE